MRSKRIAGGAAIALLALAFGPTSDTADAGYTEPGRFGLTYDVFNGGFHLLTVDVDLSMAQQRYGVVTRLRTTGFLSWLLSWSQVSESEGVIGQNLLRPVRYRSEGEFRGRHRMVEIDYNDGRAATVRVDPAPGDDEERDEVPEAMRREGFDPMTAILGAVQRVSAGQGCDGRLPVFDGRRRYDLVLTDRGRRVMPETRYSTFAGEALQCDFVYEPIAGHVRRRADPEQRGKRRVRSGRVYAAAAGGTLVLPVRVEIDGDWGVTIAHLREMRHGPSGSQ